jgi:uncharacterized membrane protein YedE/YeeE
MDAHNAIIERQPGDNFNALVFGIAASPITAFVAGGPLEFILTLMFEKLSHDQGALKDELVVWLVVLGDIALALFAWCKQDNDKLFNLKLQAWHQYDNSENDL